jgi:hypothetical protein
MVHDHPDHDGPSTIAPDPAVPRSARARRERKVRLVELARRIGVNPRTIYKWLARGLPVTLDEPAVREWARMQGIRGLREPLTIEVPRGAADAPGTTPSPGAATAAKGLMAVAPPEGWSPAQHKALADADLSDIRKHKVQLEVAELERRLVDRQALVNIAGALATVFVHELVDLPAATVRLLDQLPVEWQKPLRQAVAQAIDKLRGNLESTLRAKLEAELRGPGVSRAG